MRILCASVTLLAFLALSGSALAIMGSIQPPRMVLRGETLGNVSGYIDVINPNNFSVNISADAAGGIMNTTRLGIARFELQPNETRRVGFDIRLPYEGIHEGEIIFIFSQDGGKQGAALSATVVAIAEGLGVADKNMPQQGGITGNFMLGIASMAAGIIVLAAAAAYMALRSKNRGI